MPGKGEDALSGEQVGRVLVDRPPNAGTLALGSFDGLAQRGNNFHHVLSVGGNKGCIDHGPVVIGDFAVSEEDAGADPGKPRAVRAGANRK